jgi:hypothetical protein
MPHATGNGDVELGIDHPDERRIDRFLLKMRLIDLIESERRARSIVEGNSGIVRRQEGRRLSPDQIWEDVQWKSL